MRTPFSRLIPHPRLLVLLLAAGSLPALAQTPTITDLSPTRNLRNAPRTTNVALTFSQAISSGTAGNLRLYSQQRGGQLNRPGSGVLSGGGTATLTFDPTNNFRPGETVFATVPATVQSTGGQPAVKQAYQFTAAVGGTGRGTFGSGPNYTAVVKPRGLTAADVDGDGDLDLLSASEPLNEMLVLVNDGAGSFSATPSMPVGDSPEYVEPADLDNDGDLDLLIANAWSNSVSVRFNNGSGTFSAAPDVPVGDTPWMVKAADIDADGDQDMLVVNRFGNNASIRFNDGAGNFSGGSEVAVGDNPWGLTVGDVDADGDLDLLTASNNNSTVSIRLNNGVGGFSGTTDVAVGTWPTSVALGDVDGDGDLDLVTANNGGGNLSVRLNNGTGTFSGTTNVPAGNGPATVVLADIDADGDLDMLATNFSSNDLSVRLNNGAGAFSGTTSVAIGAGPWGLVLADLNGDGDLDVASTSYNGFDGISVRPNIAAVPTLTNLSAPSGFVGTSITLTGTNFGENSTVSFNGTITTSVTYNSATSLTAVIPSGATNGFVTVITADGTSNGLSFTVLSTMTIASLAPARNAVAAPRATNVGITFNEPVSAATAGNARVFSAQRGGQLVRGGNATASGSTLTVDPAQDLRPGETVFVTVPASVQNTNGQGATKQAYQFTAAAGGPGEGEFRGGSDYSVGSNARSVEAADVDGDGDLDLLTANVSSNTVSVRLNNGSGIFNSLTTVPVGSEPNSAVAADVDGDGDLDLLTANSGANTVSVRFNNGTGAFSGGSNPGVGNAPWIVKAADVDADGDLDLLTANRIGNTVSIRLNDGTGAFSGGSEVAVGNNPWGLTVGDVDGDGDLDLLTANQIFNGTVSVRLNNGGGGFSGGSDVPVNFLPNSVALGDVDGDGDLDLLAANGSSSNVSVRLNSGTGTFSGGSDVPAGNTPATVAAADVDADGDLDLLAVNFSDNNVSVRFNNGTGTFSGAQNVPVGGGPWGVAMADLDGDGDLDLATANYNGGNSVSVRFNEPSLRGTTTISSSATSPTATSPIPVSVLFNERVTGFVAGDVTVGNGAITGGSFGGSGRLYTFTVTPAAAGLVTVDVAANVAQDSASGGNKVAPQFSITYAPVTVTTMTRDEPSPAATAAVSYTVTFSGDVTGLSASNFSLTTTGLTGASVSNVTGSGTTYTVTVSTGTGDGTLRLDMTTNAGVSPAVTVPYNSGPTYTITKTVTSATLTIQGTGGSAGGAGDVTAFVDLVQLLDASTNTPLGGTVANPSFETHDPLASGDYGYNPTGASWTFGGASGIAENGSAFAPPTTPNGIAVAFVQNLGQLDQLLTATAGSVKVRFQAGQRNSSPADQALNVFVSGVYVGRIQPADNNAYTTFTSDPITLDIAVADLTISTPGQTIAAGTYHDITITGTGEGILGGDLAVTGALVVQDGGILDDGCHVITGSGSVTVESGATLNICAPSGLNSVAIPFLGPNMVQTTGAHIYSDDATYAFTAEIGGQITGDEFPATVRELRIYAFQVDLTNPALAIRRRLGLEVIGSFRAGQRPAAPTASPVGQRGGPNGFILIGGRSLTLLSSAAGTAYVFNAPGREVFGNNVHVQRYITPGTAPGLGYRHLSAPVSNSTVNDLTTAGFTPVVNGAYNTAANPAGVRPYPTVLGFDETRFPTSSDFSKGYFSPTSLASPLVVGRGYSVYMSGGLTPDFVGTLTTGDVTMSGLTHTGSFNANTQKSGWHLLGNPYPSPLDWDLISIPAGMSNSVSVFKSTGGANGVYLTRAAGTGSLPDGLIAMGQGMFVRVTGAGPVNFTFPNAARVTDYQNPPHYRAASDARPLVSLALHMPGAPAEETDEATIFFQAGATAGLDEQFDGEKPAHNQGVPTLVSLSGTDELAVNGLPETSLTTGLAIPLLLDLPAAGTYELAVGRALNLGGAPLVLLDRLTGTRYVLTDQPVVRFTTTQSGELRSRFALVVGEGPAATPSLMVWPNPAHELVRVTLPTEATSVALFDATGRLVRQQVATGEASLRLTGLPAGVYVVRAGSLTQRLVVE